MFIWVMRDKGSEWKTALSFLSSRDLPFTPLIESVCEPIIHSGKSAIHVIRDLARKVAPLSARGRVWVDLSNLSRVLSSNDLAEIHSVFGNTQRLLAAPITPVVGTSMSEIVAESAMRLGHDLGVGICIRIDGVTRLNEASSRVTEIVRSCGLPDSDIDLIFDAQDLPRAVPYDALPDLFPLSRNARNWAVIAGSFPSTITDMHPDVYEHVRERAEWMNWLDESTRWTTGRFPVYGDYATQPAIYAPSPPFPASPSVRYTGAENYFVLRGRRGIPEGANQYIGHAIYLREQGYYREVVGTPGDLYVERIALRTQGTGNATTWRIASLQRHLHVVASQIESFALAVR